MEKYRVKPGQSFQLKDWDPGDTGKEDDKDEAREELLKLNQRLEELQELLFAEHKRRVLIVLQGMDTSGKDGVVRHVFEGVNPQGVRVVSFKAPTPEELDHDYLWRIHKPLPAKGEMVIFNRSQYEDVLVVRVHNIVPREQWEKRYDQINAFEKTLADEGTIILKFFLHISKDEQKERLQARLDDPTKHWKFSVGDLKEREYWNQYMEAYETALQRTSTREAPWYIVPADRKWFRDLLIARVIVQTLEDLKMSYPEPKEPLDGIIIK